MNELVKVKTEAGDLVFINLAHVSTIERNFNASGVSAISMVDGRVFDVAMTLEDIENRFPNWYQLI